jgi:hypothetical protein
MIFTIDVGIKEPAEGVVLGGRRSPIHMNSNNSLNSSAVPSESIHR